jgi:DNA excision repair protein ERCC-6
LAAPDGFPYAIDIYQGKGDNNVKMPLGVRVVEKLLTTVEQVSKPSKHTIYFDNFFTSCDLLHRLHEKGFKATGTIRQNRCGGAQRDLMPDSELKRKGRGSYDYRCDGTVFVVKWSDSAIVCLASNCQQHLPEGIAKRRVGRNVDSIKQPMLISKYNMGMGGVDVLDRLLGQYRPSICGKKWWWVLFTNALNISVVAGWRMFCHLNPNSNSSHLDYRRSIALCLLKSESSYTQNLGGGIAHMPRDIRYDGVGHTNVSGQEGRCVVCSKNTKNLCAKCNVRLHFSHGKDCFVIYHRL